MGNFRKVVLILGMMLLTIIPSYNVKAEDSVFKVGEVYEVVKKPQISTFSVENKFEREELNLKLEAINNLNILVNKTEAAYEVALAFEDGSYKYVDKANSLEEAKNIISNIPNTYNNQSIIPTVIDNRGAVVYATRSMGRVLKHVGGKPDTAFRVVTNIYMDKEMTKAYTYINHGYIEDVPVIEEGDKSAKILINGYTGWINKDTASGNYDLVITPINQVNNPSYYYVKEGKIYHFISSDITSTTSSGHGIAIGPAPNYLKEGTKYFSYDGNYFYTGSSTSVALDALILDLQNNNKVNAINKDNPYYNYYNYLPFRSKSNYTAAELDKFIDANTQSTSKLRGMGQAFIDNQEKYGVNAFLALGVAINESAWGMSDISQDYNNLFGMGANDYLPEGADKFTTPADSIEVFTKEYISRGYADPADDRYYGGFLGNKNLGANVKYASDPFWGEKAAQHCFTVDSYLSNNNMSKLKDFNSEQLVMYTGTNLVMDSKKNKLYNILGSVNDYGGYVGTVAVLSNSTPIIVDGQSLLEINTERNTPINNGGSANKYPGEYNWYAKGYINNSNVKYINTKKVSADKIYVQAYNSTLEAVESGTQFMINRARTDIQALADLKLDNNSAATWSVMVDKVQFNIYVKIVDKIIELNNKVKSGQKLTQAEINELRILQLNDWTDFTDNIPDEYLIGASYGWSQATDNLQNEIINDVVQAVVKAEADKTLASVNAAKVVINDMKTSVDPAMVAWAKTMEDRVNKVIVK